MSRGTEHHVEVARTARYWTLGDATPDTRDVWFVLHGYGQLARRFLQRFEALETRGRHVVAPEALSRFYASSEPGRHGPTSVVGATWMTREDRLVEIRDYVAYLDHLADRVLARCAPEAAVTVLGFSQGVATASRWTVQGRIRPVRLVLWGDFLPPDLDMEAASSAWTALDVTIVRGTADTVTAPGERARAEAEALERAGVQVRAVRYDGAHDIDEGTLIALAADSRPGQAGVPFSDNAT